MKKKLLCATAILVLGLSALGLAAGEIEVKGSTTVLPLMQKVAEAYMAAHSGSNISISGGGSSEGAKALIDGTCDIAMLSRDLKKEEIEAASAKNRPPKQIVIAYDCIVPIVHPGNKVKDLSVAQLLGIYSGAITDWKDVGGDPGKIVVVSRDSSSGTYDCWENKVMHSGGQKSRVFAGASIQASNGAVAQVISKNKLAIGYVGLGYLNKELKAVSVNGVFCSARTAIDKTFPISRSLLVATPGEPRGEVKTFIDFILSAKGQNLVVEAGFVPLQ